MDSGLVVILVITGVALVAAIVFAEQKLPLRTIVAGGQAYPNNHHVPGVGFYHAAGSRWYVLPWNTFEEGRGYYWDGEWHAEPDKRQIESSHPTEEEVARVNVEWRRAGPVRSSEFWNDAERFGFGTAINRREGS